LDYKKKGGRKESQRKKAKKGVARIKKQGGKCCLDTFLKGVGRKQVPKKYQMGEGK